MANSILVGLALNCTILEVKPKGLYQLKGLKTSNPLKQAVSSTGLKPCIQRVDDTRDDGNEFEEQSVSMQENERNFSEVYTPTVELSTVDFEQPVTRLLK